MRTSEIEELGTRVDEVLFYVWDPIGVSDEPFARGEYKSYVGGVLQKLSDSDAIAPIAGHLASIMTTSMGLPPDMRRCNEVAELLLQHKSAVQQGIA
jgi:hypothetical protein